MNIEYLADHLELVPTLADWHHTEWSALLPGWSRDDAEAELQSHVQRCCVPTTFVALDNGMLVGSASLLAADLEGVVERTPWLASVFVAPAFRRRGTGEALVRRVLMESRRLRYSCIYLWTVGQADYYRRLGWEDWQSLDYQGNRLLIMRRLTGPPIADSDILQS
jgi:GNAT superfamily N-acetyltransferase